MPRSAPQQKSPKPARMEKIPVGSLASPKKARFGLWTLWTLSRVRTGPATEFPMPPARLWVPAAFAHCFGDISFMVTSPK